MICSLIPIYISSVRSDVNAFLDPSFSLIHLHSHPGGRGRGALQKLPEDWALAFDARISGIVWVLFASFNWLTVTLETMDQSQLTLVTQTIPEIKSLNASAQYSRSFWSGQLTPTGVYWRLLTLFDDVGFDKDGWQSSKLSTFERSFRPML